LESLNTELITIILSYLSYNNTSLISKTFGYYIDYYQLIIMRYPKLINISNILDSYVSPINLEYQQLYKTLKDINFDNIIKIDVTNITRYNPPYINFIYYIKLYLEFNELPWKNLNDSDYIEYKFYYIHNSIKEINGDKNEYNDHLRWSC